VRQVNIHQAKTQLSRLLQEVAEGKEIVIARVVAFVPRSEPRPVGLFDGEPYRIADDFDVLPDVLWAYARPPPGGGP
jgi:hypothetical protein